MLAPALILIYMLKDCEVKEFRDYVLEKDKILQETVGKLKFEDFNRVVEVVEDVLKKDLMFHQTILQAKEKVVEMELNPKVERMLLEQINWTIQVSQHYFNKIKESHFLASLCDSIVKE
ncbi:hypothetical protein [Archaeoglobus sp.]